MRALTPIGRPVRYRAGNAPIVASGRREQDDERRDERVEGQHHHHVDQQDRDAHRGEQAAERLGLLLADAGQLGGRAGREGAGGRELVELGLDRLRHRAGVVTGDLGRDRRGGPLVDPGDAALDVDLLDRRDRPERHDRDRPDRQRLERRRPSRPPPGSSWTTTWTVWPSADWMLVAGCATSAARTWPATWAAVMPTVIALFGSTVTWTSGVALTRSLLRLTRSGWSASAARIAVVALSTSAAVWPVTMTLRPSGAEPRPTRPWRRSRRS